MTKTAVITDIHSNRQALEAVLADAAAKGARRYAFLGDLVGYGADPGWVVDTVAGLVRETGAVAIMGNHDEAAVRGDAPAMRDEARLALAWTHAQLQPAQRAFLAALPLSVHEGEALYVHANAFAPKDWEYITGRMEAMRSLHATNARYTFCGHMHEPMLYHLSGTGKAGDFKPQPGVAIPLLSHRQWLVIPGSCGQPRDGNPAAGYALFDPQRQELSFERVPYDAETAAARIRAAGLPERLGDRLLTGQ